MKQAELIHALYNYDLFESNYIEDEVTTLTNDSREVTPGGAFIAIKGLAFDGHQVIEEVIAEGVRLVFAEKLPANYEALPATFVRVPSTPRAQAILANCYYEEPTKDLHVVAVTGTNGKTTTSTMISDLLMALGRKTGLIGSRHYKIDQHYEPAVNTTPNSLTLQHLFARMREAGCEDAAIEASSHALQLGRLSYTHVNCAIYTNLTREHLDFHKTMERYAYAKSLLFAQLGQQFNGSKPPLAIINVDDSYAQLMMEAGSADIVTYSQKDPQANLYSDQVRGIAGGTAFTLHFKGKSYDITLPMQGSFNVSNYMAAFACLAYYYGYSPEEILKATEDFQGVEGRMQAVRCGQDYELLVDFAHTSDALENVFQELIQHPHKRIISVMGHSGGDRDSAARPGIGDMLFKYSDHVILTADNPRFEDVTKICKEIIGTHGDEPHTIIEDRAEAVYYALDLAQKGDIVLFAGKGGEGYQIIGKEKIPYDDVDVIYEYFNKK